MCLSGITRAGLDRSPWVGSSLSLKYMDLKNIEYHRVGNKQTKTKKEQKNIELDNRRTEAMVCVSFHDFIPENVKDLDNTTQVPTTAVFYTIWSYKAGKGAELLYQAVKGIQEQYPSVNRFVTLSPKTNMARRFHLRNGAIVFRENIETINYEYTQTVNTDNSENNNEQRESINS